MILILHLPSEVEESLQQDADSKGVAKESLAIDILARSFSSAAEAAHDVETGKSEPDFWSAESFESLARSQEVKPITDFHVWLADLLTIEGADELVHQVERERRERRELERVRT